MNASKLRIGTLHSLTLHCIPRIIVELKLRKPDVEVTLTMGSNQALLRDLAEGNLDAVIIGLIEPPGGGDLVSVPIFDDAIYLAVPADSPFAGLAEVDLADTLDQKFLTLKQGFVTAHSFFHAFDGSGHRPRIAMEVSDIFSLINLVSEGIGFALLPGRSPRSARASGWCRWRPSSPRSNRSRCCIRSGASAIPTCWRSRPNAGCMRGGRTRPTDGGRGRGTKSLGASLSLHGRAIGRLLRSLNSSGAQGLTIPNCNVA